MRRGHRGAIVIFACLKMNNFDVVNETSMFILKKIYLKINNFDAGNETYILEEEKNPNNFHQNMT